MSYLEISAVGKSFTRGTASTEVLRDINLDISKGEYVSIIGHSGCGKSTLLNLIAGLTEVTSGGRCRRLSPLPKPISSTRPRRPTHTSRRSSMTGVVDSDRSTQRGRTRSLHQPMARR